MDQKTGEIFKVTDAELKELIKNKNLTALTPREHRYMETVSAKEDRPMELALFRYAEKRIGLGLKTSEQLKAAFRAGYKANKVEK